MPKIDENGNLIYTQTEYEHHLMMRIPLKSGYVENYSHRIIEEVVVTVRPINASETRFMFDIDHVTHSLDMNNKNKSFYSSDNTPLGFDGYEHLVGPSLVLLGQPLKFLKPVGALGSKPGSSIASYTLSKAMPWRFTSIFGKTAGNQMVKKIGTNVVGRAAGRAVPYAGWYLTAWDIGRELGYRYGGDAWVRSYKEYKKEQQEKEFQDKMNVYLEGLENKIKDNENSNK